MVLTLATTIRVKTLKMNRPRLIIRLILFSRSYASGETIEKYGRPLRSDMKELLVKLSCASTCMTDDLIMRYSSNI